jgi:DNA-binding MarR family transcriptional regulator
MKYMENQAAYNQQIGHYLHKAVFLVDRLADRTLKREIGITLSQFLFLLSLDRASDLSISQQTIADHLRVDKAAVSRQVVRLREKGWLVRHLHSTSGREYTLSLSDEGLRILRRAQVTMRRTMTPHYSVADPQIVHDLQVMCDSLEESLK